MVLVIFVGGIILGFSLGFATMAAMAARDRHLQWEEAQELESNPAGAYSPTRKLSGLLRTPAVLLTPWL
jgi:hypothetical protein